MRKLFPDWTYTEDLQDVRERVERRAREARVAGQETAPIYGDWRDFYSRAAFNEQPKDGKDAQ